MFVCRSLRFMEILLQERKLLVHMVTGAAWYFAYSTIFKEVVGTLLICFDMPCVLHVLCNLLLSILLERILLTFLP